MATSSHVGTLIGMIIPLYVLDGVITTYKMGAGSPITTCRVKAPHSSFFDAHSRYSN